MKNRPVTNIALIGTRGHYASVVAEFPQLPDCRLAAVAFEGDGPNDQEQAQKQIAAAGQSPQVFRDWREMLSSGSIDAAIVCGPFEQHAEMTAFAIRRGIHVLTEKPAAMTLEQLRDVEQAVDERPEVHLACMMFSRYDTGFYTAYRLIEAGAVGEVCLVNARKSYKLGTRADYYRRRETYGGSILWVGSHAIDWTLWYLGDSVRRVQAFHSRRANRGHGDLEATAVVQLQMESGAMASISIDMLRPQAARTHGDDWVRIVGSGGVIEARPETLILTNTQGADQVVPLQFPPRQPLADFIAAAEGRAIALNARRSAISLTRVCLLARDAADATGRISG